MKILLVEDERELAAITKKGMEESGFTVELAHDGAEGLFMAENYPVDVIVLDIMLPEVSGFELLDRIRKKGIKTPVLLLTARDAVSDKIRGLDAGADDYLTKPFDFGELLARVRVLLRRKYEVKDRVIEIDDMTIDTRSHEVTRAGKALKLTAREYRILEYLAYRQRSVVSRLELTEHVYDESFDKDSNIIDVYINYLRNKIDKGAGHRLIHTVRGAGYMLKGSSGSG